MSKVVDVIDVMIACRRGELKIVIQNGFFLMENTKSGERVRLNKAEVASVVHGRWEPRKDVPGFVRCSVCHDCNIYDDWADGKKWNYCPNCGAKMDGDGNAWL